MTDRAAGIIVAGGSSSRMGFDKLWADLCGRPLLAWSILAFSESPDINQLLVVTSLENQHKTTSLLAELAVEATVVLGGPARRDSVAAGLTEVTDEWVVIHDAARPLVEPGMISRGLAAARETGAAILAVPETSTVKLVRDGIVVATEDRDALWLAQTPQVFRRDLLLKAHRSARGPATDDSILVEALGVPVRVAEGAYANIKVTTPVDLQLAALLLSERRRLKASGSYAIIGTMRVGIGHDLHPLVSGRPLVLGGVQVPHARGLEGHSDGDVLTHAVADALIGAAGAGDLGTWFPDTDEAYRGADSLGLLREIAEKLAQQGWQVGNVDASLVAQRPHLAPYLEEMRGNLASALSVESSAVNVKATSPEYVGSLGREDAIAAYATALIERNGSD